MCVTWTGITCLALALRSTGADRVCPVVITPDRMVIEYGGRPQAVQCQPNPSASTNVKDKPYWEVPQGTSTERVTWTPDTQQDWDPRPACTGKFDGIGKCQKLLDYTLYSMSCSFI